MKGKQYIYGAQLNEAYSLADCLSIAVGGRANYYDGYYRGHVRATDHPLLGQLAALELDVDQRGWGFTPIVSANYHSGPLTLTARYEFRTKLEVPNTTNTLSATLGPNVLALLQQSNPAALQSISQALGAKTQPYQDGELTRYDMPALLSVAAGYAFTDRLRATVEYHFFDDKNAKMANDRQQHLTHGTNEFLAGVEGDLNDRWTLSWGIQRTDYGLSDDYQQNTSFACDSWSIGLGAAVNLTEKLRLNAGYFCTLYEDYTKQCTAARDGYNGQEIYSRTNHVIGLGLDWKF
jgi:long-chain fatty acid transport protein